MPLVGQSSEFEAVSVISGLAVIADICASSTFCRDEILVDFLEKVPTETAALSDSVNEYSS
jgi:hypothetical protein